MRIMLTDIEQTRLSIIDLINYKFDRLVQNIKNLQPKTQTEELQTEDEVNLVETIVPLSFHTGIFIGKKPIAVIFGEERVATPKWVNVYEEIIRHCIKDPVYYEKLMDLRGKAVGKLRVFLSSTPDGMIKPSKITEDLYAEKHYGAQGLMHILVNRLLAPIGYDYSNIRIVMKI